MKKVLKILLWVFGCILLVLALAVLVTRCSNEMADDDFVSVIVVEVEKENTGPLEAFDSWLGKLWWNLTASDAQKEAYAEALESNEREKETAE